MKKIFPLFLLLLFYKPTAACLNYYYSLDKEGHLYPLGETWKFPFDKNFNPEMNVNKLKKLEKKLQEEKNYMLLSDYALCLMKLDKPKEALDILTQLYVYYPNEYQIASNLGTAFELNGKNDSALKYIKRGLQLNPHDHEGSEWIHIKILETKQKLKTDPAYLNEHSVLELTPLQKKDATILEQINIQLKERMPFTPAPDAIMANLFTDMGDISANIRSIEYARAYYQIAREYYGNKSELLNSNIKNMVKLIGKYSSIEAPITENSDGSQIKISYLNYKELLIDNNKGYHINWKNINTDVPALLAMADLSKTVEEIKHQAAKDTGELQFNEEHNTDTLKKPITNEWESEPEEKKDLLSYIFGTVLVFVALLFFYLKRKKRKK